MNFINPFFFLGLTAVFAPILIHLVRKDDSRKMLFSSLIFVRAVPLRSLNRQTLRNWPLLLLRILGIVLLIFGFARPYLTSRTAKSLQFAGSRSIVVLLDNSFSMRVGNHFETGRKVAEKIINGMSDNDMLQMALFSDTVQVLNQPARKSKELASVLMGVHPGYRKTDYVSVLQFVSHQMLSSSLATAGELHIISDFQETGWNRGSELSWNDKVKIVPHDISGSSVANQSVNSPRYELDSNRDAHFSVQVASYGKTNPASVAVNLLLNEKPVQEQTIFLKPGESQLVEFNKVSLAAGIHSGQFSIRSSDLLKEDDTCYFSVSTSRPYRVLILSDRVHPDSFYFSSALTAGTESPFQAELSDPERVTTTDLSRYAAVALNNVSSLPAAFAPVLESYLLQGGKLWIILGNRTDINFFNSTFSRFLPATLARKQGSDQDLGKWHFGKVKSGQRVFEIFNPTHLSQFRTVSFSGRIQCQPNERSEVLAAFDDGLPLLLERNIGKGSSLLYCSSVHPDWNDFPLNPLFVPFVQQMARSLVNFAGARKAYWVGDSLPLTLLNPQLVKEISRISFLTRSFTQNWRVISPSGERIDLKDESLAPNAFITVEEQGFYKTKVQNVDNVVAVNIDPGESNLEAFDPNIRLAAIQTTGGVPTSSRAARGVSREGPLQIESQQGIGHILLALALAVLVIETFLSNHYDEGKLRSRVSLPREG